MDLPLWQHTEKPCVAGSKATAKLVPLSLKDAPALIESVFPAQKISYEAQKERKANLGQTLTGLGSYWKGRKPLILVRAIVLGSLLSPTGNSEADLAIFEKLMAFDEEGLARRALAANAFSASKLQKIIQIDHPKNYFGSRGWRQGVTEENKLVLYRQALATLSSYENKASISKRPEELEQNWLYAPVWKAINCHYAHLGIHAESFSDLVEQFGILRYGHRPRVGDTFCGGGSIPFEAARIGCDVYASDLNPIACMLTWGALNIIGSNPHKRAEIKKAQEHVAKAADVEVTNLGIEHDEQGNRAKAYLYCLEARCPETGWMIPLAPSWVISRTRNVVARLKPDHHLMRFNIEIASGISQADISVAEQGTVQDGNMVYILDGKTYRTPIKTLRGDFRNADGSTSNRLRHWEKSDFRPRPDDIFQERLYAIQWITKDTLTTSRQKIYFSEPTDADIKREQQVNKIVAENLLQWMSIGLVPDMAIEPGEKTDELIRTRGWTYWHHLFTPRQLLYFATLAGQIKGSHFRAELLIYLARSVDTSSRLTRWDSAPGQDRVANTFSNQALNTLMNSVTRSYWHLNPQIIYQPAVVLETPFPGNFFISSQEAKSVDTICEYWITDPPYADAVNYHEITEFFIAWLRKNPPKPFDEWVWDSRRVLAIKGSGEDFRRGMVAAYKAMANHMPNNGMQCVMFTHQDTSVWSDLIGIFWAAGLQVLAAWYIATETASKLKKGGYVQGTVILMLKKRSDGDRVGFKQRILPAVRQEVTHQIEAMMHLNDTVKAHHGEPVFGDADLQMAGYAAALKILTAYTHIGGEDITNFILRPRVLGEVTVVDEIVGEATEIASNLLVPEGLTAATWSRLTGIERFVLRMMDMETAGATKLDNYQNFAKVFRIENYSSVMGDMRPNHARLKRISEYTTRELMDSTEIGATRLGRLINALQQLTKDIQPQTIVDQLRNETMDFLENHPLLIDMLAFIERNSSELEVRSAAAVLGARLKNLRLGD